MKILVTAAFVVTWIMIAAFFLLPRHISTTRDMAMVEARLAHLEELITEQAAKRCMNVQTSALHISVYDVPNVGKKEVK